MTEKIPTTAEWKKLFAVAARVKEMAPWEWMMEDDVFGVQNPDDGKLGFVSVMGAAGEHFAVAVYLGERALHDFLDLEAYGRSDSPAASAERVLEIPQLQASFEDRSTLRKEDLDIIKKLGLKFRGANNWPMFRSYVPGMFPWFLSSEEASILTCALEQFLEVAPRFRADNSIFLGYDDDDFLIRNSNKENGKTVWGEEMKPVPRPPEIRLSSVTLDSSLLDALKQLPTVTNIIEIEFRMMPAPIHEKKSRPYFPYILMIAESQSGMILANDLLTPLPSIDEMRAEVPAKTARHLLGLGVIPEIFAVRSEMTADLLEPLAREMNIRLKISPRMPAIDSALDFMMQMLR
jgi:hypothetical protein